MVSTEGVTLIFISFTCNCLEITGRKEGRKEGRNRVNRQGKQLVSIHTKCF